MVHLPLALILTALFCYAQMPEVKMRKPKKEKPVKTQTLEAIPEPPAAVNLDSSRALFLVSPLSSKGLLSQQIKDALSNLRKQAKGATIVKLRGFVTGRGDARRLSAMTGELFQDWHLPIPAVSTIQAGALPLEGAQILVEAIAEDRKPHNPHGLDFLPGLETLRPPGEDGSVSSVVPLLERTLNQFDGDIAQITCYVSALEEASKLDALIAAKFPAATRTLVQAQRALGSGLARCEAVRRRPAGQAESLVLTSSQIAFPNAPQYLETLESRLLKVLSDNNAKPWVKRAYAVSRGVAKGWDNFTVIEGVGSNEAVVALELIGVRN